MTATEATEARPPARPRGAAKKTRRRTSLALRIALLASVLVLLAVGAAVVVTAVLGSRVAAQAAEDQLDLAYEVQEAFRDQSYQRLWLAADLFKLDPYLGAYVAQAAETADTASILDVLAQNQEELGFDFAAVLTPDGRVLAHTERPDAPGEDLSDRPLVERALTDYYASGVWAEGDRLYDAVVVSVARGLDLAGYLLVGSRIDDALARTVEEASGGRVAYFAGPGGDLRLAGTTLETPRAQALADALRARPSEVSAALAVPAGDDGPSEAPAAGSLTVDLDESPWLARVSPLLDAAGQPVGAAVTLASLDEQLATYRQLQWILTIVGAAAVLLAIACAYPLARRSLRPVRELAEAAEAARQGDYDRRIADSGDDEVGRLGRTLDELLASLREKRDMEAYMSHLSLSLPGAGGTDGGDGETGGLGVPAAEEVVLLAVDLRRHARSPKEPERSVAEMQGDLDRIAALVSAEGGRPEALLGHRALVSFVGPRAALRALSVAVPLVDQARRGGAEDWQLPTVAVASGAATRGTLQWGRGARRGLVGLPVARVDSLLRDASPGEIVLTSSVRESLSELFGERGLAATARSGLVSSQRLYAVSPEEVSRLDDLGTTARTVHLGEEAAQRPVSTATGPIHVMDTEDAERVAAARAELPPEEAAVARLGPGSVLGGRFEIVSVLGSGGMGVVFQARDRELDELVALKVLRRGADGEGDRLKEELRLARRITHPNVLRTYDFGELDGVRFVSMESVRGVTLRTLLDRAEEPLPFRAALRVARQVAAGLAAAHEIGVIHRDVKPENVILDAAGNAKVMDFGIARTVTETSAYTKRGEVVGTPHYLAPERLKNEPADARADVYSLGVMLYEVFVGRPPFPGGTLPQIVTQHLHEEPPAPRTIREELPEELEQIVLRCLAKAPEERYADAGKLLEALGRVQG